MLVEITFPLSPTCVVANIP